MDAAIIAGTLSAKRNSGQVAAELAKPLAISLATRGFRKRFGQLGD